jgi:hypothetical protein
MIGDLAVQIVLSSDAAMHELATGPTQLVINVPAGTATRFIADDPGFGHYGYEVSFAESGELSADGGSIAVQLEAYAPATDPAAGPLPLVLEFTPLGNGKPAVARAEGRANEWVRLQASLAVRDINGSDDPPPPDESETKDKKKHKKRRGKKTSL